ncbi:hypothetical protein BHE74_00047495 [Ensete ventricosum]|nr:hypothetical protein BHE74_00047495 [Ensete ventricosum]
MHSAGYWSSFVFSSSSRSSFSCLGSTLGASPSCSDGYGSRTHRNADTSLSQIHRDVLWLGGSVDSRWGRSFACWLSIFSYSDCPKRSSSLLLNYHVGTPICNVSDKGRLKERVVAAAVRATIGRDNGGQRLRGCRWWHRQPSTTWLAEEEEVNDDGTMSGGCTWLRAMEEDVGVGSAVAMVGGSSGRSNNDEGGSNWPRGCRW